ncbi:MAG: hypothetical protein Q8P11_02365 [bacterium]|nr:hypothetical protein [bacterium]
MRYILVAIIMTLFLTILQVSVANPYPFALISFAAWMWWAGTRAVSPWAFCSVLIIDLYSPVFGSTLFEWILVLGIVSIVSVTILTNRSLLALLAITIGTFLGVTLIDWVLWYVLSFFISNAPSLNMWQDINVGHFVIQILGTIIYTLALWLMLTKGKRGKRVYLVSDQAL